MASPLKPIATLLLLTNYLLHSSETRLRIYAQARFFKKEVIHMFRYRYEFATQHLFILSEIELYSDQQTQLFQTNLRHTVDIYIYVYRSKALPQYSNTIIHRENNFIFSKDKSNSIYLLQSFNNLSQSPAAQAKFQLSSNKISVMFCHSFFPETINILHLWRIINLPFQLLQRGVLTLHSSSVRTDDGVILFCGRSGIGKSTQAALWSEHQGAMTLNGDRNAIAFDHDVPFAYGLPFCGTSGICHRFAEPVRAIISLRQASENRTVRLNGARALLAIANNTIGLYYNERSPATTDLLLQMASCIPVYQLSCTPDVRAVDLLKSTLEGALHP